MEQVHYMTHLFRCLLYYLVKLTKHFVTKKSPLNQNSVRRISSNQEYGDDVRCDMYLQDNDVIAVLNLLGLDTKHIQSVAVEVEGAYALLQEKESSVDELEQAFQVFDLNGDGFISAMELKSVMSKLGLEEGMEIDDCQRMIGAYDRDSDGKINFEDFKHLLENAT